MKRTVIFLILIFSTLNALGAERNGFVALYVKGNVFNATKNKRLSAGDTLIGSEKIQFWAADDFVALSDFSGGRSYLAWPLENVTNKKIDFLETLRLSSENWLKINENYIAKGTLVAPSDEFNYPIAQPPSDSGYYFFSFRIKDFAFDKIIPYQNGVCTFSRDKLFKGENYYFSDAMIYDGAFFYFNSKDKTSSRISYFKPIFYPATENDTPLARYESILRNAKVPKKSRRARLLDFLTECYGTVDKPSFETWMTKKEN